MQPSLPTSRYAFAQRPAIVQTPFQPVGMRTERCLIYWFYEGKMAYWCTPDQTWLRFLVGSNICTYL